MNHTELDLIVAELMYPVLVDLAPSGNTIGYKEIAELIKDRNPNVTEIRNITQRHIGRKLGTIWEFTKSQGCPHIGSLVVSKGGECGSGITSIVKDLPGERKKVREFDWTKVSLGFESYMSKMKIQKKERDAKKIKRSRGEAKDCFYSYWKEVKDKAPVSIEEAKKIKEKILELVQGGMSPEEAFSQELIRIFQGKKNETPSVGFVYLGEYIDSETREPLFNQFKVGYSSNLEKRANTLSGGVSGPLEFDINFYWEFDSCEAFAVEQALHGRFSCYRKKGEFFDSLDRILPELIDDEITSKFGGLLKSTNFGENT
ncbi:GIY-YIG nuclease family protein [Microbulbifer sp. DLAB2-AA]|uniref:GIY-YIG nuclease family protein n=1 Tax=Microbulbifer sp. DLAB2-AA TaxID=3243394 RepID=UPI0040392181